YAEAVLDVGAPVGGDADGEQGGVRAHRGGGRLVVQLEELRRGGVVVQIPAVDLTRGSLHRGRVGGGGRLDAGGGGEPLGGGVGGYAWSVAAGVGVHDGRRPPVPDEHLAVLGDGHAGDAGPGAAGAGDYVRTPELLDVFAPGGAPLVGGHGPRHRHRAGD